MNASYVASSLYKRLKSATDWLTALKTLVVIHRLMRETEAGAFMEEMLRVGGEETRGRGGRVLAVDNFLDTANIEGRFDFSEWVRAYGKYLDETLEVFSAVAWHTDTESTGKESKMRTLSPKDLLQQLPYLQRLQRRLVDCLPRGQAARDDVVLLSLTMTIRESFKLYKALSEGLINLADCFFSLDYLDATKGLESYREAVASGDALIGYYASLQNIHALKSAGELPVLSTPPADFIQDMEMYIKDAPRPESHTAAAAAVAAGSGEGGAGDGGGDAVVAPPPRRVAPLRKGRMTQSVDSTGRTASSSGGGGGGSGGGGVGVLRDPGMLLPAGVGGFGGEDQSAREEEKEEEVEEVVVEEEEVVVDEVVVEQQPPPIVDLLGFDDDDAAVQEQAPSAVQQQSTSTTAPSAMDLLGELDFGSLSVDTAAAINNNNNNNNNNSMYSQNNSGPPPRSQPAIHDAFVVRAAADVYGRPPELSTTPPPPRPGTGAYYGGGGGGGGGGAAQQQYHQHYYTGTPPAAAGGGGGAPWALALPQQQTLHEQQMQQPLQYPLNQNPFGQNTTTVTMPMASPSGHYQQQQQQQWGAPQQRPQSSSSSGMSPPRDPQLFVQAGAHDPFSALLPSNLSPRP